MDFQRQLLEVGKAMGKEEVKALTFLCTDLLGRNPTSVESANDLFSRLGKQDYLSAQQPQLLTELLLTIQRTRLLRDLNLNYRDTTTGGLISPYRKLLYNLHEEITDDDLKLVKFLLNPTLPRRKLEDNITMLEIFLEMEHMDLINDTNLNELENIFQSVCPVLNEKIYQFKAQQAFQSQARSPMDPSNFSVDALPIGEQCVTPPHELSGSNEETSNCVQMSSDATGWLQSQENTTSPEKETSQTTNSEGLAVYPMTAAKRGICLIINNIDFSQCNRNTREGTMADEKSLQAVFGWLGFAIEIHRDCTSDAMPSVLRELSSRDHSRMDCVVCCILSHGREGTVEGVDGRGVKLKVLKESLNAVKCPSLAEKPKLFFIQACQGTKKQKAVHIETDGPACSRLCSDAVKRKYSIPCDADFLLAMATVPLFVSYRDKKIGSWFIQSLCQHLVQMVPRGVDLMSILTQVNADVSQKTDDTGAKKQMPQPAFTLTKRVVFPVPEGSPPNLSSLSHIPEEIRMIVG